jgi:hypothetical protein
MVSQQLLRPNQNGADYGIAASAVGLAADAKFIHINRRSWNPLKDKWLATAVSESAFII